MEYAVCILVGLLIGSIVAWLLASARLTKSMTAKLEESERRANTAEGRASGLEGTIAELRTQNQKVSDDFTKIRDELARENGTSEGRNPTDRNCPATSGREETPG